MKSKDSDEFIDNLVIKDLTGDEIGFDEEDIEFLRENPEVLDKLGDATLFKRKYAYFVVAVAVSMMTLSKVFQYTKAFANFEVLNDILTTVMFSVSSDLLGASLIIFLMDLFYERRIQRNREIIDRLQRGEDVIGKRESVSDKDEKSGE